MQLDPEHLRNCTKQFEGIKSSKTQCLENLSSSICELIESYPQIPNRNIFPAGKRQKYKKKLGSCQVTGAFNIEYSYVNPNCQVTEAFKILDDRYPKPNDEICKFCGREYRYGKKCQNCSKAA